MASFSKIGNKWQARIRKSGFPSTSENFDTHREAKAWAAQIECAMNAKLHKDKRSLKDLTLDKLIDQYLGKEKSTNPYGKTKLANLKRIRRMLGDVPLAALTFDRLVSFIEDREVQGAGGVTIWMDVAEIAAVLRSGKTANKYEVDKDLFSDIYRYMSENGLDPKSNRRSRRPTEQELKTLKTHFEDKERQQIPMWDIIDFAVSSAMRSSEITRIRWADVDFEKKTVIIRQRKHPKKKRDHVVPLLGKAWDIAVAQPRSDDRIFPYSAKTISSIFPRATQACGIDDLRFHDLRHEAASRLFEQGYDIPRVALVTGHMDWKMLERYTHFKPEDLHPAEDGSLSWHRPITRPTPLAKRHAHQEDATLKVELANALRQRHPLIFGNRHSGIMCGKGWFDLLDVLFERLQFWTDRNGAPQVTLKEAKEKYGELSIYLDCHGNEEQNGMITMAEEMSTRICEQCGMPGRLQVIGESFFTGCPAHTPAGAVSA